MNRKLIEKTFRANKRRFIEEWMELLRFPSIGTDPAHSDDCQACAKWLVGHLEGIGMDARLLKTPTKPLVYAEKTGADPHCPAVLIYGHYDVQPVDPLEEWKSGPFDPVLRKGRIYARGAEDNKGQFFSALKAVETLIHQDSLGCTVKVLLEGEEESGSRGAFAVLPRYASLLKADVLMVSDTGTVPSGAPTVVMGLRGAIHVGVELSGPLRDLHSGLHGGVAPNPATEMARLIATLHGFDGSIAVEGFYDNVRPPTPLERRLAGKNRICAGKYAREVGVRPLAGERRYSPVERLGFRPAIDINGIHSGYGGPGSKTIIPARAIAKISARIVSGQDPRKCVRLIIRHLRKHAPAGLQLRILESNCAGSGLRLDPASPLVNKARKVMHGLGGGKTAFLWEGASIPIVAALAKTARAEPLLVGFGHDEDRIHAPNESFSIEQFRQGYLYTASILSELGR